MKPFTTFISIKLVSATFALLLVLISCSAEVTKEELKDKIQLQMEELYVLSTSGATNQEISELGREMISNFKTYTERFPNDEQTPEYILMKGNIQADILDDYETAIATFERVFEEYPEHEDAERALFLIGYTYAEMLNDYDSAEQAYLLFLETYPDSELSESVSQAIQMLGVDINDLDFLRQEN